MRGMQYFQGNLAEISRCPYIYGQFCRVEWLKVEDRQKDDFGEIRMVEKSSSFPFHKYCGFCEGHCEYISVDDSYVLVTNIWNEEENINRTFDWIRRQTARPKIWIWIDDGSTDRSSKIIENLSESIAGTDVWLRRMPPKERGSLDTIGRAYQRFLPKLIPDLDELDIGYFAVMDVDTEPCPNYFARLISLLNAHPRVGAAAGIPLGEVGKRLVNLPMGGGKVVRWDVVREIKKYWDIAPDTLLNIKALAKGYDLKTWQVPLRLERPTTGFTSMGVFRQGRLNYYVGRPFWNLFFRALRRALFRDHGTQMLRGYFHEWIRGSWRFDDPDVRNFYGANRNLLSTVSEVLDFLFKHKK